MVQRNRHRAGFTLVEVLVAVAILAFSLASLLSSQMAGMQATRHARALTNAVYLAEQQLIEIEWEMRLEDGWGDNDREFEGDFSDEGWPEITYTCLVDMIEMPDYTELVQAKDAADTDGVGGGSYDVQDADDQAFGALGLVWPMVKNAIELSIRKASCKIMWKEGRVEHEYEVNTFWTDANQLTQLPALGGEATEDDDTDEDPGSGSPPGTTNSSGNTNPSGRAPGLR